MEEATVSFQDIDDFIGFCAGTKNGFQIFGMNPNLIEEFEELKEFAREEFLSAGGLNQSVSEDLKLLYKDFYAKFLKAKRAKN